MRRTLRLGILATATFIPTVLDFAPAAAGEYVAPSDAPSILNPAYEPTAGHGDSVSAVCEGTEAIKVGVHPWDDVPRTLQVLAEDGTILAHITSGHEFVTIPLADKPAELHYYSGEIAKYGLDTSRCAAPVVTVPPPTITVPPPTTSTTVVDIPQPIAAPPIQKRTGIDDPPTLGPAIGEQSVVAGVSATRPTPTLPDTGGPEGLLLGLGALCIGIPVVIVTRKRAQQ